MRTFLFIISLWAAIGVLAFAHVGIQGYRWRKLHRLRQPFHRGADGKRICSITIFLFCFALGTVLWPLRLMTYNYALQEELDEANGVSPYYR